MSTQNIRLEVMQTLEKTIGEVIKKYLKPVEEYWQPSDFLPDTNADNFHEKLEELQDLAHQMSYDLFVVLIGDTITEEALPTYESWIMDIEGVDQVSNNSWSKWVRAWTAEENRHGDLLSKYLYLSGRCNMKAIEITTHHLIQDGFDIETGRDPYKNFVYTSFQELATNISHRRVASQAKQSGNHDLAKMCGVIASDEARHANAYKEFVKKFFEYDASEMMIAFEDMMRKKIVMPAHLIKETSADKVGELFKHFSDAAQRTNEYTTFDYIDIMRSLLVDWNIDKITGLNDAAEKARDYVMKLPDRMLKISERIAIPEQQYTFSWVTK